MKLKVNRKAVAWIGIVLSVLGMVGLLISNVSKWWVLIPVAILVWSVVGLFKQVKGNNTSKPRRKVNWLKVIAWLLCLLLLIATIIIAIFFGWFALIPFLALCAAASWLLWLLKLKVWLYLTAILAIITAILLGVFLIGKSPVQNQTVVNQTVVNQTVSNQEVDKSEVKEQKVESQTVTNQKVDKSEVKDQTVNNQKVESQIVNNQKVDKSEVKDQTVNNQKVESQVVTNQKVENQEVSSQKGDNNQSSSKPADTSSKPEPSKPADTSSKPSHTHKYTSKVVKPTCTEKGYTTYTCTCGHSYKGDYKDALGHKYTSKVVKPTCTSKGYTTYTCACGHSYKGDYKDALGHKYTSKVVAPTTSAQGYTLHTCNRCGHSYKDNYTDKLIVPAIKCATSIRYGETLYVNLEGIKASNLLVSNKMFVSVETISDSRVAITLTEDVDGYITITDSVSRTNVVIDIVA